MPTIVKIIAYGVVVFGTMAALAVEPSSPVVESIPYLDKLLDRVPELFTAVIVLWLVFRFLERSHAKVVAALDNLATATTSLEEFLRERLSHTERS